MSTPIPQPAESEPTREEAVDHDLLTYGEVAVRLHQEVAEQRRLVAGLEPEGGEQWEDAKTRLAALEEAAERNRRQPITDRNFEQFFGYTGKATRNT